MDSLQFKGRWMQMKTCNSLLRCSLFIRNDSYSSCRSGKTAPVGGLQKNRRTVASEDMRVPQTHTIVRACTLTNTIKQPARMKPVCDDLVKTVSSTVSHAGLEHLQRQQLGTRESKRHSLQYTHTNTQPPTTLFVFLP